MLKLCQKIVKLLLCSFLLFSGALAEQRQVYNLSFPYDHLSELDNGLVEVNINGRSVVLKNSRLDHYLVESSFFNSSRKFSFEELSNFLQVSISKKDWLMSFLTFNRAAKEVTWTLPKILSFYEDCSPEFFQNYIQQDFDKHLENNSLFWQVFLYQNQSLLNPNYLRQVLKQDLQVKILEHFVLNLLKDEGYESNQLSQYYDSFSDILADNQEYFLINKFLDTVAELYTSPMGFVEAYRKIESDFPEYFDKLKGEIFSLREESFQEALESKQLQVALDNIMLTSFKERNDQTHEYVLKVLKDIAGPFKALLLLEPYAGLFDQFAHKDQRIEAELIKAFETSAKELLDTGEAFAVSDYLDRLFHYRSNPNEANTDLIFLQIQVFDDKGLKGEAQRVYDNWKSKNYSFGTQDIIWLYFNGYAFNSSLLVLVLIFAVAFVLWKKRERLAHWNPNFQLFGQNNPVQQDQEESVSSKSEIAEQLNKLKPRRQKLTLLLAELDLESDLSLEEFKKSYRQKVKEFHPDLNPNQTFEDYNMFISLQEKHDLILKLYDELAKLDKPSA